MRKYFPAVSALLFFPLFLHAQDSSYIIRGNFSLVKDGMLYLRYQLPQGFVYDSSDIVNGKFSFKGYSNIPVPAMLFYKQGFTKKYASDMLTVYLEPAHITLSGKGDSLSNLVVTGSPLTEDRRTLKKMTEKVSSAQKDLEVLLKKAGTDSVLTDSLDKLGTALYREKRNIAKEFILGHPSSVLSAILINQYFDYEAGLNDVAPLYENLNRRIKNSDAGKKAKKLLDAYTATDIGRYLPEIDQPDTLNINRRLSELKGNYVLVDFWASWCGPCRAEFDNLRKSYAKYHPKGFEIYGISYDNKFTRTAWAVAINKSNLPGIQVSSLAGWDNVTSDLFWIKAIPANFLLDKEGRIIARDLIGDTLPAKLAELMP